MSFYIFILCLNTITSMIKTNFFFRFYGPAPQTRRQPVQHVLLGGHAEPVGHAAAKRGPGRHRRRHWPPQRQVIIHF